MATDTTYNPGPLDTPLLSLVILAVLSTAITSTVALLQEHGYHLFAYSPTELLNLCFYIASIFGMTHAAIHLARNWD